MFHSVSHMCPIACVHYDSSVCVCVCVSVCDDIKRKALVNVVVQAISLTAVTVCHFDSIKGQIQGRILSVDLLILSEPGSLYDFPI